MKIKCPRCKSQLEVDAIGDFVSCSSCSVEFYVEESQKTKSLIENFHPFEESKPYISPVPDNPIFSKPSSYLTTPVRGSEPNYVIVTDIRMNFMSMVEFMVKWVLASIPALIILAIIFFFFSAVLRVSGQK